MKKRLEILATGPFTVEQITLAYSGHLPPPPELLDRIEALWDDYLLAASRDGRMLFNSSVAYLKSAAVSNGILHLELAATDYKTFLVTTLRDRAWFEINSPAAMTPALGNSILLTHRDTAYLGVRSKQVAAYPHWAHLFGGVLDWPKYGSNTAETLLEHLYKELEEELGLAPRALTAPPRVLALMRDPELAQPELVWHGELLQPLAPCTDALNVREHDALLAVTMTDGLPVSVPATPVSLTAIRMVLQLQNHRSP